MCVADEEVVISWVVLRLIKVVNGGVRRAARTLLLAHSPRLNGPGIGGDARMWIWATDHQDAADKGAPGQSGRESKRRQKERARKSQVVARRPEDTSAPLRDFLGGGVHRVGSAGGDLGERSRSRALTSSGQLRAICAATLA